MTDFKLALIVFSAGAAIVLIGVFAFWFEHQPPEGGRNLLTASGNDMRVERFEVQDQSGSPIWIIEASPGQPVSVILYGVVPQGFKQFVPANGQSPRPLVSDERLTTVTLSQESLFVHHGIAIAPDRFHGGPKSVVPDPIVLAKTLATTEQRCVSRITVTPPNSAHAADSKPAGTSSITLRAKRHSTTSFGRRSSVAKESAANLAAARDASRLLYPARAILGSVAARAREPRNVR